MRRVAGLLAAMLVAVLLPIGSAGIARSVFAPPIMDETQARQLCPQVCQNNGGTWTGKWSAPQGDKTSLCGCDLPPPPPPKEPRKKNINAGALANQQQANQMCPSVCKSANRVWQGEWKTTAQGRGGVCTCYTK